MFRKVGVAISTAGFLYFGYHAFAVVVSGPILEIAYFAFITITIFYLLDST